MNCTVESLYGSYPALRAVPVEAAYEVLRNAAAAGGTILACGNGGSAADAEHIAGELMKGFLLARPLNGWEEETLRPYGADGAYLAHHLQRGIPAFALNSHTALLTAVGNDTAFDMVFAQQVYSFAKAGDALVAMSTSGNSRNVVLAAVAAKARGVAVVGITGENAGALGPYCDVCLCMPATETFRVQEYTLPTYHVLCAMLEQELFG